jgi:glyoxylase-like metal-dependent hydrolase (beta-lactamase superfamily II)
MMRMIGRRRRDAILTASSLRGVVRPLDPDGHVPGLRDWRWVHTPGHTPGHASYVRPSDGVAVTGDAIVTLKVNALTGILLGRAGLSGPPRYTSWDWRRAQSSVAALAALEPTVLATGHGEPMTGAGTSRALQMFAAVFAGRSGSG